MIRTRTDGFSLIELMIVVGLIAVLGGMAVPQIAAGMRQYSLTSASQQIVSTIRSARAQAVGRNASMRVRFNFPAAGQYQVWRFEDPLIGWVAAGGVNILPNGANFGAVSANVEFTTAGRLNVGIAPPVTIVVSNGDATQDRTISVTSSGRVQLP